MHGTLKWMILAILVGVAACNFPDDAGGTWARVLSEGTLRVGYTVRPPWIVEENGRPSGIEARLMQAWASELGARVEWVGGSETALVEALRARKIDVLVGGHLRDSVWSERAAPSQPYFEAEVVVSASSRTAPPADRSDLRGRTVSHAPARPDIAARIAEAGAVPLAAADSDTGLRATYRFELEKLKVIPTGIVLATESHVIFVTQGESRFLYELDLFLARVGRRLVVAEAAPCDR